MKYLQELNLIMIKNRDNCKCNKNYKNKLMKKSKGNRTKKKNRSEET